jgi:uncharacterized protein YcbK (DUF882 family)
MRVTRNFDSSEFECNCGCDMPDDVLENIKELSINLQYIRDYLGTSIRLTNAYRCVEHNKAIGGAKNSQHILGKAADLKVKDLQPKTLANLIEDLIAKDCIKQGGVGRYNTFTHYDIRGTKARWNKVK